VLYFLSLPSLPLSPPGGCGTTHGRSPHVASTRGFQIHHNNPRADPPSFPPSFPPSCGGGREGLVPAVGEGRSVSCLCIGRGGCYRTLLIPGIWPSFSPSLPPSLPPLCFVMIIDPSLSSSFLQDVGVSLLLLFLPPPLLFLPPSLQLPPFSLLKSLPPSLLPSLPQIESDGTTQKVPFTAMGSGFAAAMSVLESQHRQGLPPSLSPSLPPSLPPFLPPSFPFFLPFFLSLLPALLLFSLPHSLLALLRNVRSPQPLHRSLPPSLPPSLRSSLSIQEGITLLHAAISSGIMNDLGSGSRVDICVIQANGQVGREGGREGGREAWEQSWRSTF